MLNVKSTPEPTYFVIAPDFIKYNGKWYLSHGFNPGKAGVQAQVPATGAMNSNPTDFATLVGTVNTAMQA
jgi:hypothetical protein